MTVIRIDFLGNGRSDRVGSFPEEIWMHVRIFREPIETIQVPLMITVSREDEMLANDMEAECRRLHEANPDISYHVFDTGGHPLIATRAEEIAGIVRGFLCDE